MLVFLSLFFEPISVTAKNQHTFVNQQDHANQQSPTLYGKRQGSKRKEGRTSKPE